MSERRLDDDAAVDQLFGPEFLLERPLLDAVRAGDRAVLLIDEIDRADDEFEAFLLELLSDFQITIPEIGTIVAEQPPFVVLTSNRTRELHDALKRRCLYHWIDYPSAEREVEIVLVREPGVTEALARKVVAAVNRLRALDLAKPPGVAETIDWVRTLGRPRRPTTSTPEAAADTLGAVVKDRDDLELVQRRPRPDHLRCLTHRRRSSATLVGFARRLRARGRRPRHGRRAHLLHGRRAARPDRPRRPLLGRAHRAGHPARPDPGLRPGVPRATSSARPTTRTRRCRSALRATEERAAELQLPRAAARRASDEEGGRLGLVASDVGDAEGQVVRRVHARGAGRRCAGSCAPCGSPRRAGARAVRTPARDGRTPDLRRTVRASMRTHGEPTDLCWRTPAHAPASAGPDPRRVGFDDRLLPQPAPVRATRRGGRPRGSRCSASGPG